MAWGKADQSHPDTLTAGTSKPGFFSSFGRKKKTLHVKKTDEKKLTKSRASPRGGKHSLPAFTVIRPQRSFSNRPAKPASVIHASAVPSLFPDDPAFSSDPRAHPHFSAASDANSRRSSARSQASHTGRAGGTASRAQTQKGTSGTDDLRTPPNPRIPHAPSASSHSSASSTTKTSSVEAHTTSGTSAHSSHESAPMAAKLKKFSVVNPEETRPNLPRSTSATSNPPPPYEPSIEASQEGSAEVHLRPNATRGSSAPEMYHPISQIVPPPRPTTAPAEDRLVAPSLQQRTETNTSGAPRTRDLDRIDELDESDPFGGAIHHRGPYEAIQAILGNTNSNAGGHEGRAERGPDRKPRSQRTTFAQPYPGMPMFDPHMKLDLKPGQILPRIPFYDPETLPQTPYHRQHRSVSAVPSQPPSIALPRRNKSERAPQHFPQQQSPATQSDVGHGQHPSGPRYQRPLRESQPQIFAQHAAPPIIRIDTSPSPTYPDEHQPSSQYHLQPPPNQPQPRTRAQSEQGHAQPQQRLQQSQSEYGHSQLQQRPQQFQSELGQPQLQQRPQQSQSELGHSQLQQRPQQFQSELGHSQLQQRPQQSQSEQGHSQLQQRPQQSQSELGHSQLQQRPQRHPAPPPSLQPSNLLVPGHKEYRPQQYPTHSLSPQPPNQPVPPQIQHRSQRDSVLPPSLQPSNPVAPQTQQRPQHDRTVPPSLQPSNQLAPPQVQQQPRPQQYQVPPVLQRPSVSPAQPQPPQQQSRPQQHQVYTPALQPPTLASESQGPQQQRRPQQYQTQAQQQQQQYHQQPSQAQTSQQPPQTRPRHKSEHSRSQPRPSDHGHHDPNINAPPQLLVVPGQPMSSAHSSRQSSQTPSIAPSKTVSTARSSQRSGQSQSVLTPLHVPKRLVMPSPLGTAPSSIAPASMNLLSPASYYQVPLPRLPLPQQQQQQQQQQQYQHFPLPPLQNQGMYQPMAQDVLMTTEAHQLMRKRTASQPVHVPLGEMRLQQSNTTVHFLPPMHTKDRPTEGRMEKTGKRLSKRRVVVPV